MPAKCEKRGCEKAVANTLRFTDLIHTNVDTEYPIQLCEEHTKEVQRFPKTDVKAVKKWLDAVTH